MMSDDDATYRQKADTISKGNYIVIKNRPCKVSDVFTNKTHKGTMCHFLAADIFNGTQLEHVVPSSDDCDVPRVNINEYQVLEIRENGCLKLLTEYGEARADLKLPTDNLIRLIKYAFSKNNDLAVRVMSAMGEEQICGAYYYSVV